MSSSGVLAQQAAPLRRCAPVLVREPVAMAPPRRSSSPLRPLPPYYYSYIAQARVGHAFTSLTRL